MTVLSRQLQDLVQQVPGAKYAYLTDPYTKSVIEQLDIHRDAVVTALAGEAAEWGESVVAIALRERIADRYVTIMLTRLVEDAVRNARVLAAERARLLMEAPTSLRLTDIEVTDDRQPS